MANDLGHPGMFCGDFGLAYPLYLWLRRMLTPIDRSFFVLVLTPVLVNAIVSAFSIPAPRYEARVIWLLPMAALLFAFRSRFGDTREHCDGAPSWRNPAR